MKITRHIPVIHQSPDGSWYAVCTCLGKSEHYPQVQRWQAEDWVVEHNEQVQHALAVLHRSGSLKTERDHARKMLDDPNTPAKDLPSWQVLFDGADRRLRDSGGPDSKTDGLW